MEMIELIKPEQVLILRASNKTQVLQELVRRAAKALDREVQVILDAVLARETLGSTGVGEGVAVPHARIPGLEHFFALFARLEKPIEFDSVDGQPVDLIVLLLIPEKADKEHVTALACVSRRLRDPEIARRLRVSLEPPMLYDVLATALPTGDGAARNE